MIKNAHMTPQQQVLESSTKPCGSNLVGLKSHQILSSQMNRPFSGLVNAGYQIENSRLACSVWTDQSYDLSGINFKIVIVNSPQSAEIVSHFLYLKQ